MSRHEHRYTRLGPYRLGEVPAEDPIKCFIFIVFRLSRSDAVQNSCGSRCWRRKGSRQAFATRFLLPVRRESTDAAQ